MLLNNSAGSDTVFMIATFGHKNPKSLHRLSELIAIHIALPYFRLPIGYSLLVI